MQSKRSLVLLLSILFAWSVSTTAQDNNQEEKLTAQFFKTYKTDPLQAYDNLFAESKYVSESDIATVKIKLKAFLKDLGDYLGYEPITEKRAGKSYVLKSFLVKYDRQPVRMTFIIYKAQNT